MNAITIMTTILSLALGILSVIIALRIEKKEKDQWKYEFDELISLFLHFENKEIDDDVLYKMKSIIKFTSIKGVNLMILTLESKKGLILDKKEIKNMFEILNSNENWQIKHIQKCYERIK